MADLALAVLLDDGDGIRVGLYAETGPSHFYLAGALRLEVECLGGVQPIEGTDIDEGAAFPARSAFVGTTCGVGPLCKGSRYMATRNATVWCNMDRRRADLSRNASMKKWSTSGSDL